MTSRRAHLRGPRAGALALLGCALTIAGCASGGSDGARPSALDRAAATPVLAPDPVLSIEPWTFAGAEGRAITTRHYRIFTTERDVPLRRRIPRFLETALVEYQRTLGSLPVPRESMETYIMGSRAQWAALTRQFTGSRAETYLKIRAGGFAENGRALLFDLGSKGTFGTVGHEGWHQYTQQVMRDPLPIWLEEGAATQFEGFRWAEDVPVFLPWANVERFDRLRDVVNAGRLLRLDELLVRRPQDLIDAYSNDAALDYYAQVWALVHFLREGEGGRHRRGLARVLEDAAQGRMIDLVRANLGQRVASQAALRRVGSAVFLTYFDDDLTRSAAAYEAFVREITALRAREAIVAGRSPLGG